MEIVAISKEFRFKGGGDGLSSAIPLTTSKVPSWFKNTLSILGR